MASLNSRVVHDWTTVPDSHLPPLHPSLYSLPVLAICILRLARFFIVHRVPRAVPARRDTRASRYDAQRRDVVAEDGDR